MIKLVFFIVSIFFALAIYWTTACSFAFLERGDDVSIAQGLLGFLLIIGIIYYYVKTCIFLGRLK